MRVPSGQRARATEAERDDLAPFHRLIELQKQMMALVEQNEQVERECLALRAQLAHDVARWRQPRPFWSRTAGWLQKLVDRSAGGSARARPPRGEAINPGRTVPLQGVEA